MKLKVLKNDFIDSEVCQSLSLSGEIGRIVDFVETPDVIRAIEKGIFEVVEESEEENETGLTRNEIIAELKELGIKFKSNASKEDLFQLLESSKQ